MPNYTAVTIGPIGNTMALTSSPAGLWSASYLFSWIAKELIQTLVSEEIGVPADEFISPYFQLNPNRQVVLEGGICEEMHGRGVGLFHDRIIFRSDNVDRPLEKVRAARSAVIDRLAARLAGDTGAEKTSELADWLNRYLRIAAITETLNDTDSPLMYLGKHLSAAELEPQFLTQEKENILLALFENPQDTNHDSGDARSYRNTALKNSFLVRELGQNWMLYKSDKKSIQDLHFLASQGARPIQKKYQQYYAVLKSDGDSMSAMLENMSDRESIQNYSRQCLLFCAQAAKLIQDYGGLPIYAGGDDLLALVPVAGVDSTSVFALVEKLRDMFNTSFAAARAKYGNKPTISFGVAVQYVKSPLYEALERADHMLCQAKSSEGKNACFLNLQKHSGQSLTISESKMDNPPTPDGQNLFARLEDLFQRTRDADQADTVAFLSGAGYQVKAFETLFHEAIRDQENREGILKNLYENLFDNAAQKEFRPYLDELRTLTQMIFDETCQNTGEMEENDRKRCVNLVEAAIRALHFMNEKKEEDPA